MQVSLKFIAEMELMTWPFSLLLYSSGLSCPFTRMTFPLQYSVKRIETGLILFLLVARMYMEARVKRMLHSLYVIDPIEHLFCPSISLVTIIK